MQSGHEDTVEERYAIKLCFKLGKKCHRNVWNASDCFSTILHESSIQFLSDIRDSRKARSLWGIMRGMGGVRESIHHSWWAKGLGVRVTMLRFLREFSKRFLGKKPALFKSGHCHFHQDNTPVHSPILATDYLSKMVNKTFPHSSYSPDLAPFDF